MGKIVQHRRANASRLVVHDCHVLWVRVRDRKIHIFRFRCLFASASTTHTHMQPHSQLERRKEIFCRQDAEKWGIYSALAVSDWCQFARITGKFAKEGSEWSATLDLMRLNVLRSTLLTTSGPTFHSLVHSFQSFCVVIASTISFYRRRFTAWQLKCAYDAHKESADASISLPSSVRSPDLTAASSHSCQMTLRPLH